MLHPGPLRFLVKPGLECSSYPSQEEAAEDCWTACSHAISFSGANSISGPPNSKSSAPEAYCRAPCWLVKLPVLPNCN